MLGLLVTTVSWLYHRSPSSKRFYNSITCKVDSNTSTYCFVNTKMIKSFWICIFTTAFPISVAPKNVQNGTKKWPHVMPARSNSGFGIDAAAKIPKNPTRCTRLCMNSLPRVRRSGVKFDPSGFLAAASNCSNSTRSSSSSSWEPVTAAARAMK